MIYVYIYTEQYTSNISMYLNVFNRVLNQANSFEIDVLILQNINY